MCKQILVQQTIDSIRQLPKKELREVSKFIDAIIHRNENSGLTLDIQKVVELSETFKFLETEEALYRIPIV